MCNLTNTQYVRTQKKNNHDANVNERKNNCQLPFNPIARLLAKNEFKKKPTLTYTAAAAATGDVPNEITQLLEKNRIRTN